MELGDDLTDCLHDLDDWDCESNLIKSDEAVSINPISQRSKNIELEQVDQRVSQQTSEEVAQDVSQEIIGGKRKTIAQCPYYKKIADTEFVVDAFNYGLIPGVTYYLLSHFHYDHYIGLKKTFKGTIVTSHITGKLVVDQIGVDPHQIIMVGTNQPIVLDGITIILIDANHCPGSVMFLFILQNGKRILHTGDFRASIEMEQDSNLLGGPIDHIYLDTTYCSPDYNFPSQGEVLQTLLDITIKHLTGEPKLLIVCGCYTIGKEKVFKTLSNSLSMGLWVEPSKAKIIKCLDDCDINEALVINKDQAQIHVLPMKNINHQYLQGYLKGCSHIFKSIIAFKPTGWTENGSLLTEIKPNIKDNIHIYGLPYSEHSSFNELERFIKFFKPRMITPTVIHSNLSSRVVMFKSIAQWKSSYLTNASDENS